MFISKLFNYILSYIICNSFYNIALFHKLMDARAKNVTENIAKKNKLHSIIY